MTLASREAASEHRADSAAAREGLAEVAGAEVR